MLLAAGGAAVLLAAGAAVLLAAGPAPAAAAAAAAASASCLACFCSFSFSAWRCCCWHRPASCSTSAAISLRSVCSSASGLGGCMHQQQTSNKKQHSSGVKGLESMLIV